MVKSRKQEVPPAKAFQKALTRLGSGRHQLWRVFADFCALSALSYANALINVPEREERYLNLMKGYTKEEAQTFPELLGLMIQGLEDSECECDFLGDQFQELELSNHWKGQFFTPWALCRTMAEITLTGMGQVIERKGFLTIQEPACGAGAMLIGCVAAMRSAGFNPQQQMHVTAIDVDETAAHMCFVQLSALGIPARVYVGNTLSLEMRECFVTPAHYLGLWDVKLRRGHLLGMNPQMRFHF